MYSFSKVNLDTGLYLFTWYQIHGIIFWLNYVFRGIIGLLPPCCCVVVVVMLPPPCYLSTTTIVYLLLCYHVIASIMPLLPCWSPLEPYYSTIDTTLIFCCFHQHAIAEMLFWPWPTAFGALASPYLALAISFPSSLASPLSHQCHPYF